MSCLFASCIEQRAIEFVSNLGQEHLFVANCPSEIDADKHSVKIITFEEAFGHCDTGVGLCLLLPKAFVLRKFVDYSIERDISVHFVFTAQVVLASLRPLHGCTICYKIRFNRSAICRTSE